MRGGKKQAVKQTVVPGAPPRSLSVTTPTHAGADNGWTRARLWHSACLWTRPVKRGGSQRAELVTIQEPMGSCNVQHECETTSSAEARQYRWTDQRIGACWSGMFGVPADVFKVLPEAAAAGTFTRHQGAFTWRGAVITLG